MNIQYRSVDISMYYGANSKIVSFAKQLRAKMTIHERLLWQKLRNNQILGLKFRAQHPIDYFIVDFYCHKLKFAIEIDGKSHENKNSKLFDEARTSEMENYGISLIRFKNEDVSNNIEEVVNLIEKQCQILLSKT